MTLNESYIPLGPQFSYWSDRDNNTFQSSFLGVFVMLDGGNGCEGALKV